MTRTRVELPRSCRNLCVLLLGPRQVCSAVAAWYAGVDNIADTGLSSGSRFTLVKLKPQVLATLLALLVEKYKY